MRFFILFFFLFLSACATLPPPNRIDNVCYIFRQYPDWYQASKKAERDWGIPVDIQMAIIHQESKFQADAKPPYQFFLGIIPLGRPSSAFGYTQALDATWDWYQKTQGRYFASRQNFKDGVDFVAWYSHIANRRANIPKNDAYRLYLAYHEGIGGYMHRSYLKKPWLIRVAHKVSAQSAIYRAQLRNCPVSF
jgi:hypothetical protein